MPPGALLLLFESVHVAVSRTHGGMAEVKLEKLSLSAVFFPSPANSFTRATKSPGTSAGATSHMSASSKTLPAYGGYNSRILNWTMLLHKHGNAVLHIPRNRLPNNGGRRVAKTDLPTPVHKTSAITCLVSGVQE